MSNKDTKHWIVDNKSDLLTSNPQVEEASLWITRDEVVAFPTETVYGLGANALSDKAIGKIYEAKGRPSDNPLIVHISNANQLTELVLEISDQAQLLINAFWPGPLTLIFKSNGKVSEKVTAGLPTVAIRMPDHPVALALIEKANLPLAAPSANLSGKPSPTKADHVIQDLQGRIAGVLDGGSTGIGLESTVLDCTQQPPMILRPGGITKEQLEIVVGPVTVDEALLEAGQAPKSPGMKYAHYAPKAPLTIVEGDQQFIQALVDKEKLAGKTVAVLTTEESKQHFKADVVLACGYREDLHTVAQNLYDTLRLFDEQEVDVIFSEAFPREGVGEALMNRLSKAAAGQFIKQTN